MTKEKLGIKEFVQGMANKVLGRTGTARVGITQGNVQAGKMPYSRWYYSSPYGIPRGIDLGTIRAFANDTWNSQCIGTLAEEIAQIDWDVLPEEKYEEKYNEQIKDEIIEFFKYPNKDDNWNTFIKKLLNDAIPLDQGVIVKTFSSDSYDNQKSFDVWKKSVDELGNFKKYNEEIIREPDKILATPIKGDKAKLIAMYVAPGQTFTIDVDIHGRLFEDKPTYYQYSYAVPSSKPLPFFRREIAWFKMNPSASTPYGRSAIEDMMDVLESLSGATKQNKDIYQKRAIAEGIIKMMGIPDDELEDAKNEYMKELQGKGHRIIFTNGDIDFKQITMSMHDMEWLNGMKFYQNVVMAMWKVPPAELGYTFDSKGKNPDDNQNRIFIRKGVMPYLRALEAMFNSEIVPEFYQNMEQECRFKFMDIDKFEEKLQRENDLMDLKMGLKTINEIRRERGLDPVEWGDTPMIYNPIMNEKNNEEENKKMVHKMLKKKNPEPVKNPQNTEEVKNYDDFLEKYYTNLEKQFIEAFKHSNLTVMKHVKNIDKSFGQFLSEITAYMDLEPKRKQLKAIIKADYVKGVEKAESELGVQIGYDERFEPIVNNLTEEQINGYILPDGKQWFGIVGTNQDIQNKIHQGVMDGLKEGESLTQITRRIKDVFTELKTSRAMMIARTESARIIGTATNNSYIISGLKGKKVWLTAKDDRLCKECMAMNGQKVAPTEAFTSPLTGKQYMNEPVHVNCRCNIYFEPDEAV